MIAESTDKKTFFRGLIFTTLVLLFQLIAIIPVFSSNLSDFSSLKNPPDFTVTVIDGATNDTLFGVTVVNLTKSAEGTLIGGSTDINGQIVLNDPAHSDEFEFSYTGYMDTKVAFHKIRADKWVVRMFEGATVLETAVIVGRTEKSEDEIPNATKTIDKRTIANLNAQNSADILWDAGAYIQKSQMGGGSPILRGFESNRVLLVVDGVRMNNAIYRSGHLQNSISIDNSILERAEVIYGPGSLMYGSDALGGVVHYRTRDPKLHLKPDGKYYQFTTNAFTRFSTANSEKTVHIDMDYGTDTWGSLTSVTYSDFGDLRSGSKRPDGYEDYGKRKFFVYRSENVDQIIQGDPDLQRGTAYDQIDLLQKVKFQPKDDLYFVMNLQYSTSSNVPRYDNLTDTLGAADELKWAEWYYGPQQRMLASLKMKVERPTALFDKSTIIAAFQRIDEDRLKRKFRKTHRTFNLENVFVYSFTGDFEKYLGSNKLHTFSYGVEGSYNQVDSRAGRMNLKTGNVIYDELTRYPSAGSSMLTYAGYASYNWQNKSKTLNFNFGGRYTNNEIKFSYLGSDAQIIDWPEEYYQGLVIPNSAVTWGIGLTYKSKDNWQFKGNTSTAFRAPNLDDLAKVRPKNGKATVPNPSLQPEFSLNYEATLGKQIGKLDDNKKGKYVLLSATGFYTELTDVIVREKGELPDGSTTIIIDDSPHDVQQNFNAGEGFVYGASGNLKFNFNNRLIFKSGINYTYGRRAYKDIELAMDTLLPLDHIPPVYGRASLTFQTERLRLEGLVRFNGSKAITDYAINSIEYDPLNRCYIFDREGLSDNIEHGLINHNPSDPCQSIYEGLPSWVTYNLYASYKFSKGFSINVGVENITDIQYRNFGSGISAPGRNFSIAFRGSF